MVRIGTRGSKLALWQAEHVKSLLGEAGIDAELVLYTTKGDQVIDQPLHKIGDKGLFTKALDDGLLNHEIDIAVHSSKDIPSRIPEGLEILAFLKREDARDVLLATDELVDLDNLSKEFVIGTSSLRRVAQIRHYSPNFKVKEIRGNVDTRVEKLKSGEYDALILAFAGVKRMGFSDMVVRKLNTSTFTPAVGQGAVGVIGLKNNRVNSEISRVLNHLNTSIALKAERSFLYRMEGGCQTPVFALATVTAETLSISGGVASEDGKTMIRFQMDGNIHDPEKLGIELADKVLNQGGREILNGKKG